MTWSLMLTMIILSSFKFSELTEIVIEIEYSRQNEGHTLDINFHLKKNCHISLSLGSSMDYSNPTFIKAKSSLRPLLTSRSNIIHKTLNVGYMTILMLYNYVYFVAMNFTSIKVYQDRVTEHARLYGICFGGNCSEATRRTLMLNPSSILH